jgi:predicted Zn-dependent protease with MMP-like domain
MKLTTEEFAELVERALEEIPEPFEKHLQDVAIDIEPMPDLRTTRRMGLRSPRFLLGLYHGTPLTQRSVEHPYRLPDRITIYQRNIERICRTHDEIIEQVRKTVLHEVGHHFGMEEGELRELGY